VRISIIDDAPSKKKALYATGLIWRLAQGQQQRTLFDQVFSRRFEHEHGVEFF
jgi:hypothetical protein